MRCCIKHVRMRGVDNLIRALYIWERGYLSVYVRVSPDIISGPGAGRNPAKFLYSDMAAIYEARFDHLSMHLPHRVIGQEFIVLQIR